MLVFIMVSQKLVQAMLSKASEDILYPFNIDAGDVFTQNNNLAANALTKVWEVTTPWDGKTYKYTFNLDCYTNCGYGRYQTYFTATVDGVDQGNVFNFPKQYSETHFTNITFSLTANTSIEIYQYNPQNTKCSLYQIIQTNTYSPWVSKCLDGIKGKPRELKTIGNNITATIFWIHIDGSRVTQD